MDRDNPLERHNAQRTANAIAVSEEKDRRRKAWNRAVTTATLTLGSAVGIIIAAVANLPPYAGFIVFVLGLFCAFLMLQGKRKDISEPIRNSPSSPARILEWIEENWYTRRPSDVGFPGHARFSLRIEQRRHKHMDLLFLEASVGARIVSVTRQNDNLDPRRILEILLDEHGEPVGIICSTLERFSAESLAENDLAACRKLVELIRTEGEKSARH